MENTIEETTIVNVLVNVSVTSQIKAGVAPMGKMRIGVDLAQLTEDQRTVFAIIFDSEDASLHEVDCDCIWSGLDRPEWAQRMGKNYRIMELDHPATPDAIAMRLDAIIAKGKDRLIEEREKAARKEVAFRNAILEPEWVNYTQYGEPMTKVKDLSFCDANHEQALDMGVQLAYENLELEYRERAEVLSREWKEKKAREQEETEKREQERVHHILDWAQVYEKEMKKGYDDGIIDVNVLKKAHNKWFRLDRGLGTENTDNYDDYEGFTAGLQCLEKYREVEQNLGDEGTIQGHGFYKVESRDDYGDENSVIMEYTVETKSGLIIQCGEKVMDLDS